MSENRRFAEVVIESVNTDKLIRPACWRGEGRAFKAHRDRIEVYPCQMSGSVDINSIHEPWEVVDEHLLIKELAERIRNVDPR